ncbi:MAG: DEAD/DEAH box helicase [Candidatus Thermoplasmatota archaeon]|nr:DEAD/DEAH box helicase [Candidatus Thermoplasmatota archaeon]MDD5778488.1 DEAD/DEAH box helicase [Candidatus Thermoplasmatota archaeon]
MKFEELNINTKLLEKTKEHEFTELTDIQEKCMSEILKGKDVVGQAETGSGKTLAFGLPILERITQGKGPQALVLTPTRELCVQITDVFRDFGQPLGIKTTSIYGGVSIEPQIKNIPTADIIVGTPGRVLDHLTRSTLDLRNIRFLVLDETDRMLDMGFIHDVETIIRYTPKQRQTLMFSATISEDIHRIMNRHLRNPLIIKTRALVDTEKLSQFYYDVFPQNEKFSLLVHLLKTNTPGLAIVFCATRRESDIVTKNLRKQGVNTAVIHGGMNQASRLDSLHRLKNNQTDVLVATDVAARGLDIKNVTHVYNYDVPKTGKEYVHRIGRTARAGENGHAVTLLTDRDYDNFRRVQQEHGLHINRVDMPDFKHVPFVRGVGGRGKALRQYKKYPSAYGGRRTGPKTLRY